MSKGGGLVRRLVLSVIQDGRYSSCSCISVYILKFLCFTFARGEGKETDTDKFTVGLVLNLGLLHRSLLDLHITV